MTYREQSRRDFLRVGIGAAVGAATGTRLLAASGWPLNPARPVVSVVKVRNDRVGFAVEKAIDLLGGIETVAKGKERIMLKPNLVGDSPDFTTKREVIRSLSHLMKASGKEVSIGEGSAAAGGFNERNGGNLPHQKCGDSERDAATRL